MLLRELRRRSLPMQRLLNTPDLLSIAAYYRMSDVSALYAAIGESKLDAGSSWTASSPDAVEAKPQPTTLKKRRRHLRCVPGQRVTQVSLWLAQTTYWCGYRSAVPPVPGDEIIGFVTRGSGYRCTARTA